MLDPFKIYQGSSCKRGHSGIRWKRSGACVDCMRARRPSNKEASRLRGRRAWPKRRDKLAADPERKANYLRRRREWKRRNRARLAGYQRERINKRGAHGHVAAGIRDRLYKRQSGRCAICVGRLKKSHVDHIEPLALGGAHTEANLQLLCPPCNLRKGAKPPLLYARELGKLL